MAKGLKLDMVAEGVEQDYQLRYLRKLQCQVVQGFIYSQCLTANEMQIKPCTTWHCSLRKYRSW